MLCGFQPRPNKRGRVRKLQIILLLLFFYYYLIYFVSRTIMFDKYVYLHFVVIFTMNMYIKNKGKQHDILILTQQQKKVCKAKLETGQGYVIQGSQRSGMGGLFCFCPGYAHNISDSRNGPFEYVKTCLLDRSLVFSI